MRRAFALALLSLPFLAASCGAPAAEVRHDDRARDDRARDDHHDATPPPTHAAAPSRALAADATFDDVVALARGLDGSGDEVSTRGCLMEPARFTADVAVPVRPLPSPWDDASALLAPRAGAVRVLSRWGATPIDSALAVAAFTTLPPLADDAPVVTLFLTSRGVWARASEGGDSPSPVDVDQVPQGVPLLAGTPAAVVVVADRTTSLSSLRALLSRLDAFAAPVALGVPFPVDTHLPATAPAASSPVCPNGLPAPPASATEGDLDPASALATLGALHPALSGCAASAPRDGIIDVVFRIGTSGSVTDACAKRDHVGRAAVRACVVDAVRALHFSAPSPAGYIDVDVPLRLTVDRRDVTQRPMCAP